jgi:hypothetical protein
MKNLKYYDQDCFRFHEEVVESKYSTKDDPHYKDRIKKLSPIIKKAFSEYEKAFRINSIETLISVGYTGKERNDLQNLYSFKSQKLQELLKNVTTTISNRKRSTCTNCTVSEINSFDHSLPQTEFAEFVVNPLNLIPSCTNCNSRKGKFYVKNGEKLFLNLYTDKIPDIQFLKAEVDVEGLLEIEIKFHLYKPKGMDDKIFALIKSHYTKLKLFKRFLDNADDVVSEFENDIVPYLKMLSKKEIEECVNETLERNRILYGRNYWKCVLKEALLKDKKFMDRFVFIK